MEGPQFSTKAESNLYRSWGAHVVGMTTLPEARLAREAEICYTGLCFVTDYDCWRENTESVTTEMILTILRKNVETSKKIIGLALPDLSKERSCSCKDALRNAIATGQDFISNEVKKQYNLLIGKYMK